MKLKKYFQSLPMQERISFAENCETTFKHLQNVAYGYRPAGESLCINIERESDGAIKCEELRPDVDWEFLRGTSKQDQTNSDKAA